MKFTHGVSLLCSCLLLTLTTTVLAGEGHSDNSADWFYQKEVAEAKFNTPILVRDTDSALGRLNLQSKELGLKDLVRIHGHACDGLVISFVEIRAALEKLFPEGVVDRTDLRVVSKNGPCWVDAGSMLTGARINFKTLRIDKTVGDGFIVQRISTGEAYDVHLKPGVFPAEQAALEGKIRKLRSEGSQVTAEEINTVEKMASAFNIKLLSTPASELLDVKPLPDFKFAAIDTVEVFGNRGDVVNKDMPR